MKFQFTLVLCMVVCCALIAQAKPKGGSKDSKGGAKEGKEGKESKEEAKGAKAAKGKPTTTAAPVVPVSADDDFNCDVHGMWGGWTSWSNCDCEDTRMRSRSRLCDSPEPAGHGESCSGMAVETMSCSSDCGPSLCWDEWALWSNCDCETGLRDRERECKGKGKHGEKDCHSKGKNAKKSKSCLDECPEPMWIQWSAWSDCDCLTDPLNPVSTRTRVCHKPFGSDSVATCTGPNAESAPCTVCNGGWGAWDAWSECNETERFRLRPCNNPSPTPPDGLYCVGPGVEFEDCESGSTRRKLLSVPESPLTNNKGQSSRKLLQFPGGIDCTQCFGMGDDDFDVPIDGGWSEWSAWGDKCSKCGGNTGVQTRKRTCTEPEPDLGGAACEGPKKSYQTCKKKCDDSDTICKYCKYYEGTAYKRNPMDCAEYYTCHINGGITQVSKNKCSGGLFWSNSLITCQFPGDLKGDEICNQDDVCKNPSTEVRETSDCDWYECWTEGGQLPWRVQCAEHGHKFSLADRACVPDATCNPDLQSDDPQTPETPTKQALKSGWCQQADIYYKPKSDPSKYVMVDPYTLTTLSTNQCPKGQNFDFTQCWCVSTSVTSEPECQVPTDVVLYLPFDNDYLDYSCHKHFVTVVGEDENKINLVANCFDNRGCVELTGGKLSIYGFRNWFGPQIKEFSVSLWMNMRDVNVPLQGLMHNGNCDTEPTITLQIHHSNETFAQVNRVNGLTFEVTPNVWNHLVLTFDTTTVKYYFNGQLVGTATTTEDYIVDTNCIVTFGERQEKYFKGLMDEVIMYKKALTAAEVLDLYNLQPFAWYP